MGEKPPNLHQGRTFCSVGQINVNSHGDDGLAIAMIFLDISERGVPLPEKYWDYYSGKHVFNHNCQAMYQVMATVYDNTPNRVLIGRISSGFSDIFHLMDIFEIEHAKKMSQEEVMAMHQEYNRAGLDQRAG